MAVGATARAFWNTQLGAMIAVGRCPPLVYDEHATPDHTNATLGSVVTLTCDVGYQYRSVQSDRLTVQCQARLRWNVTDESCERESLVSRRWRCGLSLNDDENHHYLMLAKFLRNDVVLVVFQLSTAVTCLWRTRR